MPTPTGEVVFAREMLFARPYIAESLSVGSPLRRQRHFPFCSKPRNGDHGSQVQRRHVDSEMNAPL